MSSKRDAPYTKAELARHFQTPESTIRYYCSRFAAWLPFEGEGRKRLYAPACLDVLAYIRERLPEVRTASAMEALLQERFPTVDSPAGNRPRKKADAWEDSTIPARFSRCLIPENPLRLLESRNMQPPTPGMSDAATLALSLLERQGAALERIADALASLAEQEARQGEEARELRQRADLTDTELNRLRQETQTLRLLLDASEKTQQQDLDQLRKWLGKVISDKKRD